MPLPFILLASQRTGSMLLVDMLNQHSAIAGGCWGEFLFHLQLIRFRAVDDDFLRIQQQRWHDVLGYLPTVLPRNNDPLLAFAIRRSLQLGAGLKVTRDYDLSRDNPGWPLLLDRSIAWLHLVRNNKLRQLVSLQAALQSAHWHYKRSERPRPVRVQLDPERVVPGIRKMEEADTWHRRLLVNQRVLELEYGQILQDGWDHCMQRVWGFLELPLEATTETLRRGNDRPLEQVISNWRQVRCRLLDSPYAWMWSNVEG